MGWPWRSRSAPRPGPGRSPGRSGREFRAGLGAERSTRDSSRRGWPGAGAAGDRRLAAGPARRVGAGRPSRCWSWGAAVRRAVLVGVEGPPARIQPGPAATGRAAGCGPGRRPAPQRAGGRRTDHRLSQPGDHAAAAELPARGGDAAARRDHEIEHRWQRRFGVTHGVWGADDDVRGADDPGRDRRPGPRSGDGKRPPPARPRALEAGARPRAFPPAWVARRVVEARAGANSTPPLERRYPDQAWFLPEDLPPALPEPIARAARVRSWDGRTATVEHDGSCILILRRTYYPGWFYRVDGGPAQPVLQVNGGLQAIPLPGAGTQRVELQYRPTGLARAATVTLVAPEPCCSWSGGGGSWSERPGDDRPAPCFRHRAASRAYTPGLEAASEKGTGSEASRPPPLETATYHAGMPYSDSARSDSRSDTGAAPCGYLPSPDPQRAGTAFESRSFLR